MKTMNQQDKEHLLNEIEHKVGMVRTFYKDIDGSKELIDSYDEYKKEGVSYMEINLYLEDLNLFLETEKRNIK